MGLLERWKGEKRADASQVKTQMGVTVKVSSVKMSKFRMWSAASMSTGSEGLFLDSATRHIHSGPKSTEYPLLRDYY